MSIVESPDAAASWTARETVGDRLRLAVEMHDLGRAMYRQRMVREHPGWSTQEVEAAVHRWLAAAPLPVGRPAPERLTRLLERATDPRPAA